jgi:hypothetical protein
MKLVGGVLVLVGLAVLALSVPALAVVGIDDTLSTGDQNLTSDTAALATAEASLGDEDLPDRMRVAEERWRLQLDVASADRDGSGELFLGIGPSEEVEPWLDEVAWDKVTVFSADGTDVRYDRLGDADADPTDLPEPADEDFWTVSEVGSAVSVDWDYREGHYTIVLMNADGSPGVDAEGSLSLEIPKLSLFLALLPAAGLALVVLGALLFLLAWYLARRSRRHQAPKAEAAPPAATEVPATAEPTEMAAPDQSSAATEAPQPADPAETSDATAAPKTADPAETSDATAGPKPTDPAETSKTAAGPKPTETAETSKTAAGPEPTETAETSEAAATTKPVETT